MARQSMDTSKSRKVPDLRFINRKVPIIEIARALDLRFADDGHIHCWRLGLHHNGDRTASVSIRETNNTVKCFGCDIGPLGVVDLVMAVLDLKNPGDAARWVADRFHVPEIAAGQHVVQPRRLIDQYGRESEIGLLIRSGLWAELSQPARALAPVLLEFAEPGQQIRPATISFLAMSRYSGVASPNAIVAALRELEHLHWLSIISGRRESGSGPVRAASTYLLTPRSDELLELANANFRQMREEIDRQRQIRAEVRAKRKKAVLTK